MRRTTLPLLLALCCAPVCASDQVTIHGFVVDVASPATIRVDDFSVTRSGVYSLELPPTSSSGAKALKPEDVRIGDEIEIKGDYNAATRQLAVKRAKILSNNERKLASAAFPDKPPELRKTPSGWDGYLFVDGLRVRVTEATPVTVRRTKEALREAWVEAQSKTPEGASAEVPIIAPLESLDQIGPATMARYEGASGKDGALLASKVEFETFAPRPHDPEELLKLAPTIQKGDALISQPDELHIGRVKYKLAPSGDAQEYVQKLGESLIPAHQRAIPADSPLRIDYRFYLVEDKDFDVLAFPNGVIIVKSGLFDGLENEAQLAFHIARAMAHVEEKDDWRVPVYDTRTGRMITAAATFGAAAAGVGWAMLVPAVAMDGRSQSYLDSFRDQADRLALEWMLDAGYDIREAPRAYKSYALTHPDHTALSLKPDPNQAEMNQLSAGRRAFLMTELRSNYSGTDYASLKRDSGRFHAAAKQARDSER